MEYKIVQPLKNSMVVPQNIKHVIILWSSNFTPKKIESKDSNRFLYTHFNNSTTHNNQKVEATEVSASKLTGKQNVIYSIPFNNKNKWGMIHVTA